MKILLKLEASETQKSVEFDNNDVLLSDEDWELMSDEEKAAVINDYVEGFDHPYWEVVGRKKI